VHRLLLISSSRVHGSGYLEYCGDTIGSRLDGLRSLLFIPFALHDRDAYAAEAARRFNELGFELTSIHQTADPIAAVESAEAVFVGGGNTFRLLRELWRQRLVAPLRRRVAAGMPYLGASAGSNVACPTIKTTNDMPIVEPPTFEALGLIPFQINPHFVDADPTSTHQGETREQRLREFHEENDMPVLGLREGAILRVDGPLAVLDGVAGARLFRRGQPAAELDPGDRVDDLLAREAAEPEG
jgi:dipeptidase E